MTMGQRKDFIEVAKTELGVVEGPKDNETKYGAFTKANFLPWCGSYVMWCANQVGLKIPNVVSTSIGAQAFMKKNQWEDAEDAMPVPGDIIFFDFPGDNINRISHVGIVVKDNGDGTVNVMEGNTSPDKKGDQRNGGEVCLKRRAYKKKNGSPIKKSLPVYVIGFGKPVFKS
jgi:surface antigen